MVIRLISSSLTGTSTVHFLLPTGLMDSQLIYDEWLQSHFTSSGERLRWGLRAASPLIDGVLTPILLFAAAYGMLL